MIKKIDGMKENPPYIELQTLRYALFHRNCT